MLRQELTFRHAGDLGDIIYFMPTMRAMGGGTLFIEAAGYTRVALTPDRWCGLDLLLKQQPYVADVVAWDRRGVHVNGNDFRARMHEVLRKPHMAGPALNKHLAHWMSDAHGMPRNCMDAAWLTVTPKRVAPVVVSRSGPGRASHHVYHNPSFPWHRVWRKYGNKAVFVGTPEEHRLFCATCGELPHHPTANLLEVAEVIAGADLFIGNQSCPHAIAEGLKKNILLEVWPAGPNCLVYRPGVTHWWRDEVELPDV